MSPTSLALALCFPLSALAQGVATEQQLTPITVSGERAPLDPNLPSSTASRTAEELRAQNLVNPEDALLYVPNTMIRKRYIGDRNALIGGRSFSPLQAPRGLAFMDGYLISNFLGRFDAPRWNMVAPEEIERVDVLYGPFSAIYPGNSIGTTVVITTRMPKQFEASGRIQGWTQKFEEYGVDERFNGKQFSGYIGSRLESGLAWSLGLNHLDTYSHPMQYYTVSANAAGVFPAVAGAATPVTGVHYDTDPKGLRRAVFGASSGAIDHTVQDHVKLRLGYDFTPTLAADAFVAYWKNDTANTNRPFIRDAAGNLVWSGRVSNNGTTFNIPAATFAPSNRDEEHIQGGFTLKTRNKTGWNASLVVSAYEILADDTFQADNPEPIAQSGGTGTVTRRDGTGWKTFEIQSTYTPTAGDFGDGKHALTFGLHHNAYDLSNVVYNASDWRGVTTSLNQSFFGKTRLTALYAQDAWQFAQTWRATFGVRQEHWRAFEGFQFITGAGSVDYPSRTINATSPKLSVTWTPVEEWLLRGSVGKGVRFPTVAELFQGTRTGSSIQINDPNLNPERSLAKELTWERFIGSDTLRVSLFEDDIRNTIYTQTNTAVVPNITNVQNVGRVRTRGIEFALAAPELPIRGLALDASLAINRSKTLENNFLASVGKNWVRVPKVRATLQASYRPNAQWQLSAALRHSGRQWNELDNSDVNPDTFGGVSRYTVADVRVAYKPMKGIELALGVDNVNNERYYQFHPFPQRTVFAELRGTY